MVKKQKVYSIERKQARWGFAFTVPCLVFFAIFSFYPIIYAFVMSFTNRQAIGRTYDFVGLENYQYIFTRDNGGFPLSNSIKATFIFTIGTFIPLVVISLALATFMMQLRKDKYRGFFQLMFYTPAVLSSVVAAAIWMQILDPRGIMNQITNAIMRTQGVDYNWLVSPTMLQVSTILIYFWKYIGYFVILFITGLASIPGTLYEAATVDGSSRWHTFWKITLPLLKPTTLMVSIMAMLQCLKTFSTQFMLYRGGSPRAPIDVITMNIYFTGIRNGRLGRASAMSLVLFVIMLVFTYLQLVANRSSEEVEY